jgi:hypothetical protein
VAKISKLSFMKKGVLRLKLVYKSLIELNFLLSFIKLIKKLIKEKYMKLGDESKG